MLQTIDRQTTDGFAVACPERGKIMYGISPNFGDRCIWVHIDVLISFSDQRLKVKVTKGNDPKKLVNTISS